VRDISGSITRGIDTMGDRAAAIKPGVVDVDGGACAVCVDVRGAVMNCHIYVVEMSSGGIGLIELVQSRRARRGCKAAHNIDSGVKAVEARKKKIRSIASFKDLDV
jgi:hypothetical protein